MRYKVRNWHAVAASTRNAGPMKDRREERGGCTNDNRDYLDEYLFEDELDPSTTVQYFSGSLDQGNTDDNGSSPTS